MRSRCSASEATPSLRTRPNSAQNFRYLSVVLLLHRLQVIDHLARDPAPHLHDAPVVLQQLARHVELQVRGVDHAAQEAQPAREQRLEAVHDQHAPDVELEPDALLAEVEIEGRLRRNEEQRLVLGAAPLGLEREAIERLAPVVRDVVVELGELLVLDLRLGPRPHRLHRVEGLVLEADGVGNEVGVPLDDPLEHRGVGVVLDAAVGVDRLQVERDGGAAKEPVVVGDLEALAAGRLPAGRLGLAGAARHHRDPVGDHEGGVEADAELADELGRVLARLPALLEPRQHLARAGLGDGAEVLDHLVAAHADAVVRDRERARRRVRFEADLEDLAAGVEVGRGERFEAQAVERVRGVGDQLAQEDLLVGVERVDDDVEELAGFRLEGMGGCVHGLSLNSVGAEGDHHAFPPSGSSLAWDRRSAGDGAGPARRRGRRLAGVARPGSQRRLERDRSARDVPRGRSHRRLARPDRLRLRGTGGRRRQGVRPRLDQEGRHHDDGGQRAAALPRRGDRQGAVDPRVAGRATRASWPRTRSGLAPRPRSIRTATASTSWAPSATCSRSTSPPVQVAWSHDFVEEYDASVPIWGTSSAPLVDGDLLIAVAGAEPDGKVIAYDKRTGAEKWRAVSSDWEMGYEQLVIVEAGGARQLVVWEPQAVFGLDPSTGKVYWSESWDVGQGMSVATPVTDGKRLLLSQFYRGSLMLELDAVQAGGASGVGGHRQERDAGAHRRAPLADHHPHPRRRHRLRSLQLRRAAGARRGHRQAALGEHRDDAPGPVGVGVHGQERRPLVRQQRRRRAPHRPLQAGRLRRRSIAPS